MESSNIILGDFSNATGDASMMNGSSPLGPQGVPQGEGSLGAAIHLAWPCNHTGPVVMREKYPLPMLVEAARTIDVHEIIQIVAFASVFAVSVCGNLIIMVVVYLNSFLRSTINYYLVNLAVSDLLITLLCWPTITNQLTQPLYFLGRPLCKISVLTQTTCVTTSVLTLSAVALDRLYAVMLPLRARSSKARPLTLILAIWFTAVVLAIPAFIVRDVQVFQWDDLTEESCSDILPPAACDPSAGQAFYYYRILLTVMLFFLPAVIMIVAYAVILLRLWCVKRPATPTPQMENATSNPHIRAKRKIVKMTAMVLLAFLICWGPLYVLMFYNLVSHPPLPQWYDKVIFWAYFLGYCNSALNPVLYGGFSDNFRLGFKNMLRARRCNSDFMHLPSSAMATTSISFRMSSRPRRSSVFQTHSFPLQTQGTNSAATTAALLQKYNEQQPRAQSVQYSRRSSVASNYMSRRPSTPRSLSIPMAGDSSNQNQGNDCIHQSIQADQWEHLISTQAGRSRHNSGNHAGGRSRADSEEPVEEEHSLLNGNLSKICENQEVAPQKVFREHSQRQ